MKTSKPKQDNTNKGKEKQRVKENKTQETHTAETNTLAHTEIHKNKNKKT